MYIFESKCVRVDIISAIGLSVWSFGVGWIFRSGQRKFNTPTIVKEDKVVRHNGNQYPLELFEDIIDMARYKGLDVEKVILGDLDLDHAIIEHEKRRSSTTSEHQDLGTDIGTVEIV